MKKATIYFTLLFIATMLYANNCVLKDRGASNTGKKEMFEEKRKDMVLYQIKRWGISDEKVIDAMQKVPRERFVPENLKDRAYDDGPLPIGEGQTISQPYIVAYMTEQLRLKGDERVLEIGTGSGYQSAILAEIAKEVYTVEIIETLSKRAQNLLSELGYKNIKYKIGDGYSGWEEYAPFDAIILTAAPSEVPSPLLKQLKVGGRLIAPIGETYQELILITHTENGFVRESLIPVVFVPMRGEAEKKR